MENFTDLILPCTKDKGARARKKVDVQGAAKASYVHGQEATWASVARASFCVEDQGMKVFDG